MSSNNKKEILQKLKTLADRGVNGEKENAENLLSKLMKKYNISEDELEQEYTKDVFVTLRNYAERKICCQILYAYFNGANLYKRHGDRTKYFTELTPVQEIEFKYMLSVYIDAFYKEQDIFIRAFIYKNGIFPVNGEVIDPSELPAEERGKSLRASLMMQGMEKTIIRKCIGE